ncbi:MFS transporter [Candidatus Poribacteria bacterium]|nr:MFS transporter [Candidatus Poribacteria bacterium]MBT5536751.1 MFS transporter [Candidatus Poribacteria bacterium]MBT5713072.1 MFS transporter [Candidatus Poribacteria bacterium]MBT7806458.1 MFS transporter [Candidatus Poribacteria bacterium]
MQDSPEPAQDRDARRSQFGWAIYDWANSAYSTAFATAFLPLLWAGFFAPAEGIEILGRTMKPDALWSFLVAFAALVVLLIAPTLGAVADMAGAKKRLLIVFCYVGVAAAAPIALCGAGSYAIVAGLFIVAHVGFIGANVFYDAFLPDIAPEDEQDGLSSRGFAYGYVGGGLQFAMASAIVMAHERLGLSITTAMRIGMGMAILWWAGFALVTVALLKEERRPAQDSPGPLGYVRVGFARVWRTTRAAGKLKHLTLFLAAFLAYNNGIQTVIAQVALYAQQHIPGVGHGNILATLLAIQFVASVGAIAFGRIAGRVGAKRAVMLALGGWIVVVAYVLALDSATEFFIVGCAAGLVLGGAQALSRSLYSVMIPDGVAAEFFGFYSVFNKASAIFGPLVYGLIRWFVPDPRWAIFSVIVFFAVGLALLAAVDVDQAREDAAAFEA